MQFRWPLCSRSFRPQCRQPNRPRPANKVTTKAVGEPLKKAQEAMAKKQWDTALAEIKKAQAVEKKTPFEAYQIDEFLGYVLIQQKKYGEAAPVFERMLNSRLPAAGAGRRPHQDRRAAVLPAEGLPQGCRVGRRSGSTSNPGNEEMGGAARPVVLPAERLQERRRDHDGAWSTTPRRPARCRRRTGCRSC